MSIYVSDANGNLTQYAGLIKGGDITPNIIKEIYGENLLQNSHLTVNQRNLTTNQTATMFMADRWYKSSTNQVKVNLNPYGHPVGTFEFRFMKTLTEPIRVLEQRIDITSCYQNKPIVVSWTIIDSTTDADNSACMGLEYFDETGASLGVKTAQAYIVGDVYFKDTIPATATSMTFFFQLNTPVAVGKLIRFCNPKVEFGTAVSKFGGRIEDQEPNLCQRYYYTTGVSSEKYMILKAISATEFEPSVIFLPTQMVKEPTITLFGADGASNTLECIEAGGTSITVSGTPILDGRQCFKIVATNAVAGNHYKLGGYTADAETIPLNVNISE